MNWTVRTLQHTKCDNNSIYLFLQTVQNHDRDPLLGPGHLHAIDQDFHFLLVLDVIKILGFCNLKRPGLYYGNEKIRVYKKLHSNAKKHDRLFWKQNRSGQSKRFVFSYDAMALYREARGYIFFHLALLTLSI